MAKIFTIVNKWDQSKHLPARVHKGNVVHVHNRIHSTINRVICSKVNEPAEHYIKQKKPGTERQ